LKLHPLIYITTQLKYLLVDYLCRDALLFSCVAWSHFMVPNTLQLFFCFLFFQNSSVTMASNPQTNFDLTSGTFVQGLPIDRLVTTHSPNKGQKLANPFF
jgi:hypothetical protein